MKENRLVSVCTCVCVYLGGGAITSFVYYNYYMMIKAAGTRCPKKKKTLKHVSFDSWKTHRVCVKIFVSEKSKTNMCVNYKK